MKAIALGPLQSSCLAGLSWRSQAFSSSLNSNFASSFLVHTSFPRYSPFCFRGPVTIFWLSQEREHSVHLGQEVLWENKIKGERLCPSGTQSCDREQGHTSDRDYVNEAMELESKCNFKSWDVTKDTYGMTEGERGENKNNKSTHMQKTTNYKYFKWPWEDLSIRGEGFPATTPPFPWATRAFPRRFRNESCPTAPDSTWTPVWGTDIDIAYILNQTLPIYKKLKADSSKPRLGWGRGSGGRRRKGLACDNLCAWLLVYTSTSQHKALADELW